MNSKAKTPTEWLLEAHVRISPEIGKAAWQRAIELLTTVEIQPSKSIEGVNLKQIKAKAKECYLNALGVCMRNHDVEYVEGYLEVHGIPLDHAWNRYKGQDFDLTQEALGKEDQKVECPHRAIMVLSNREAMKFALAIGMSGPYLYPWLRSYEKKRSPKKMAETPR